MKRRSKRGKKMAANDPLVALNDQFHAYYDALVTNQAEKDRQERIIEEYQAQVTLHEKKKGAHPKLRQKIAEATTQRDAAEAACGEATASLQQLRPRLHFWQPGEQLPEV